MEIIRSKVEYLRKLYKFGIQTIAIQRRPSNIILIDMKKVLFLLYFIGITCMMSAQITENPVVDNSRTTSAYVGAVLVSPDVTTIALSVSFAGYSWITISPSTRIEYNNPQTGTLETRRILRLQDVNSRTLSLGTKYYFLPSNMAMLVFPSIPRGVRKINLIEEGEWKWYGINITQREDVDVKRIVTTEEEIYKLISNSKNSNAGMFEQMFSSETMPSIYRLALVQTDEGVFLIYVSSLHQVGTWKCGEVKAMLRPTVRSSIYKADWYMGNKTVSSALITFDGATMKLHMDDTDSDVVFVKMCSGTQFDDVNAYSEMWSGTGFALMNGYILTNYHVVDEASAINIYGINGDFANGIKATVVGSDKANDLSLLKLSVETPAYFNMIPYGFKSEIADVGEDVYVLGYPLTATMGEEVKLTNGIVSAKTGFDGEVSQYQISAPVQPGNSGGPLIDFNGNVIGVVCAKHLGAENVSYAVKTSQVINLIESVSDLSIINTTNSLRGKSLKDQVKSVNKYVYIIKCSK